MDKNFQKLQRVLNLLDDDALTNEQFKAAFLKVTEYVKAIEKNHVETLEKLSKIIQDTRKDLTNFNDKDREQVKALISKELEGLALKVRQKELDIDKKLSEVKDGIDADEDLVVERATERIKADIEIPTAEDLLNEVSSLGERVRDSLELLKDDDRLDASAIKGLEDAFKQIKGLTEAVGALKGAISTPTPLNRPVHESFDMDGATTTVTLTQGVGAGGTAIMVRYEGQMLDLTTHYTVDGTDINLTFTPNNGTKISITYWPW